jgi:hypothetical protein
MNPTLIQWGPALLILLGIVLGVIYNNRSINHLGVRICGEVGHLSTRMTGEIGQLSTRMSEENGHLSTRMTGEIGHLSTRIDDLIRNEEMRHNDMKDFIKSEIRRLEERIERIEHPVIRS